MSYCKRLSGGGDVIKKEQYIQTVDEASFATETNFIKFDILSLMTFSITGIDGRMERDLHV